MNISITTLEKLFNDGWDWSLNHCHGELPECRLWRWVEHNTKRKVIIGTGQTFEEAINEAVKVAKNKNKIWKLKNKDGIQYIK